MNKQLAARLSRLASCALLGLAATSVGATGMNGRIANMAIDKDIGGNLLFIKLEGTKSSFPACQINQGWDFVLPIVDAADKNMFAMLVAAKAAGQTVGVRGNDTCAPQFSSIEQALGVRLVNP
ncbi:hypothetical protein [Mitsuaria sp. GD03876]|uniref:hypothetical protein n=1 Tax=Mitsuaria sp. GD03876 TaxID=2975399 RepID=UPI00244A25D3|nr:hypothetical protein [Mitsuaria sp. GD03876]MDH0863953.1 hypothetical protein [Mitsuaria sp. GD03876]